MKTLTDEDRKALMDDMRSFDPVHIIYFPSLDISGYGYTEAEAKLSFEIVYSEYLRVSAEKDSY